MQQATYADPLTTRSGRELEAIETLDGQAIVDRTRPIMERMLSEVGTAIVGKRHVQELVAMNLLANGNALFEDYPGLAKSLLADSFSKASGCDNNRIQFTPDLLPSDIMGANVFDQRNAEFEFRPGPVFTNFLLADEINRAPPKTQAALLETMQERQVTVEGVTRKLPAPYIVLATQNPTEQEGTFPLPEAQMDRFLIKLSMGYPTEEEEHEILERRIRRGSDHHEIRPVTNPDEIVWMQRGMEKIYVDNQVTRYIVKLVQATRTHPHAHVGCGPRASLSLLRLARANASMQGRSFVVPDDIKRIALPCMSHRISLKPEPRIRGITGENVVEDVLKSVPAPVLRVPS